MHQKLTYRLRPFVAASLAGVVSLGMLVFAGRMAVADAPAQDVVQISDIPLGIMADQNKPNVMLLLDTSDSMKWTHMPDDWEQDSTTYFPVGYKSALCNTLYYNPQTTYELPKRPDGRDMDAPNFANAWKDGYDQSLGTVDLSKNFQAYDNDTRRRALYEDPAQPAYFFEWRNRYAAGTRPEPHFEEPSETYGVCNKIYSGNTLWISARADNGTLLSSINIHSYGVGPDGYWTRRAIPADQRQNFANWYSYYRTRINMAKSSVSLAFSTLNDNFRIGFLTVAKPGVGPQSKFLPVADFNTEGKQQWLEAIQTIKTGGSSPDVCLAGGYGWINYLNFNTGQAVIGGPDGKGDVSTIVDGSTISGHATTTTGDGKATDHISTTGVGDKPLDIDIPYASPKPLGRRISWRELVK